MAAVPTERCTTQQRLGYATPDENNIQSDSATWWQYSIAGRQQTHNRHYLLGFFEKTVIQKLGGFIGFIIETT